MGTCCDESADNKQMMVSDIKEDHKCSSKKMEGEEEGLNTVACLRGRLLAERQASRIAKEEAESMGNKLVELEKLLRVEIKLKNKAERKLKFLKKKLESFNISFKSGQLDHSDSSEKCENSSGSSSVSSDSKHSNSSETKHCAKNSALPENVDHNQNVSEASAFIQIHNSPSSSTKDCDSQITDNFSCNSDPGYSSPQILSENPNPSYENLKNDESRLSSLSSKSSVTENESDHADSFDSSMALVPVNMTAISQATSDPKPVNESVLEALDALRHAKERLQSSLGTSRMIHVGPI